MGQPRVLVPLLLRPSMLIAALLATPSSQVLAQLTRNPVTPPANPAEFATLRTLNAEL